VDQGTKTVQGRIIWRDLLAKIEWADQGWKVTTQALDLSLYHFHDGAALTDLKVLNDRTALFLTQDNATTPVEVDVKKVEP
jgi:hypothetical protein